MKHSPPFRALIAAALALIVSACATSETAGAAGIRPDPALRTGELANGMRYAIISNSRPSGRAMVRLRFDVGSLHETENERGLAHVLEHMAFNGSAHIGEGELRPFLQSHGIAFGTDANAYTSFDETEYALNLPAANEAALDAALFALREIASELTIGAAALERERPIIAAEARAAMPAAADAGAAMLSFLYPDAAFADRLPIGDPDIIAAAAPERVRAFYDRWYRPERAQLLFVGDADPALVERLLRRRFEDWTGDARQPPAPDRGRILARGFDAGHAVLPAQGASVLIARVRPAANPPDDMTNRRERLLRTIANEIFNARLQRLAMGPHPPFAGAEASFQSRYRLVDVESLTLLASGNDWPRALQQGEQEIRRIIEHGFTGEEVEHSRRVWLRSAAESAESAETRTSEGYMFALRYALAEGRVLTHPADELQILRALLPSITPEALQDAFSEMWGDAERLVFVTTSEALNDPRGEIEHVYRASLASAVSPAAPPHSLTFAHTDFGPPGNVVDRTDDTARNITAVRFANNVRLTVQRSSSEGARAHVRVRIAGAAVSQIGPAPGWSYAFSQTFLAGGTTDHTYLELERLKEGRLAVLSLYTDYDSIVLGGETTPQELEFQLQLLAAFVSAPGFRAEAFDAYHRGLPDHYARLRATPLGVFELNRFRILYSGHPRVAYPTENEVRHWTRDNLEPLLRPVLSQGPIEIGIVGEVDIEPTIELVRRTFGALAERRLELPDHESDHAAAFAPTGGPPTVLYYEGGGEQGLLSVYWRTADAGDEIEAATLAVAAAILKQRLIERLRETEGASYSPSASNNPSPYFHGFGYFNVLTDGDAADLARLSSIIEEIVASMSRDIGEAEFEAARRLLVNRTAPDPGDLLSLDDVTRFQTTQPEPQSQMNPYPMITDDQVEDAVRRYLRPQRKLEIRILPRSNE